MKVVRVVIKGTPTIQQQRKGLLCADDGVGADPYWSRAHMLVQLEITFDDGLTLISKT